MYFWNYRLRKRWIDKSLKSPVKEDPSTGHMVNRPKHCWNLKDTTFTIFIDPCECSSGLKSLSEWYVKSWNCLLIHWVPMTSILFLTEAVYCNIFRCNYLKKEKYFPDFFLNFLNLDSILKIFEAKDDPDSGCILNLQTLKNIAR